jgi:DNA-binding MarR family transcriptional regulator
MRLPDIVAQDLIRQPGLNPVDRSVYLWVCLLRPRSMRELAVASGMARNTAVRACKRLEAVEWMTIEFSPPSRRPVCQIPSRTQAKLAQLLETEYSHAANKGEFLMKRHLDLRIRSERFIDNARSELLASPITDYRLEYDRHYFDDGVAFEYNGRQHYEPGPGIEAEKAFRELQSRDLMKHALSEKAGIRLVVVTAEDLRPGLIEKLIPDTLERNHVDENGPYFKTLSRISAAYAAKAARAAGNSGGQR